MNNSNEWPFVTPNRVDDKKAGNDPALSGLNWPDLEHQPGGGQEGYFVKKFPAYGPSARDIGWVLVALLAASGVYNYAPILGILSSAGPIYICVWATLVIGMMVDWLFPSVVQVGKPRTEDSSVYEKADRHSNGPIDLEDVVIALVFVGLAYIHSLALATIIAVACLLYWAVRYWARGRPPRVKATWAWQR